jgi:glycosyltransferase involved in cell wall biosynthesis
MKIGMILDDVFPPDPRVENEAQILSSFGHSVTIFAFTFGTNVGTEIWSPGVVVFRCRVSKLTYKLSALAYTLPIYHLALKKSVSEFIEIFDIDVLHIHDIRIARAAFWANGNRGLPVVLDVHENRPVIMRYYKHVNSFPGSILIFPQVWARFENRFMKKASKIFVVTEEARELYVDRNSNLMSKICVIPNAVNFGAFVKIKMKYDIVEKYRARFVILYIGDTGERRGLGSVLESIKSLRGFIQNIKLVVLGKSSSDSVWEGIVNDSDLNDCVEFAGWIDPDNFLSYIRVSSICISPILKNAHHDSTYANKLFQYMALSRPVLVSDCLAQANLVSSFGCGLVHQADSASHFSRQIMRLFYDPDTRRRMGLNGKYLVRSKMDWRLIGRDLNVQFNCANLT